MPMIVQKTMKLLLSGVIAAFMLRPCVFGDAGAINLYMEHYEISGAREMAVNDVFEWRKQGASDLISKLIEARKNNNKNFPLYCYHFNWAKKEEITFLVSQIDSNVSCAQVGFYYSSATPVGSTVGVEAMRIIISYWKGYYPVELDVGQKDKINKEIKNWYAIWRLKNG